MFILVALAFAILIYRIYLYLKLFVSHLFIRKIKKKQIINYWAILFEKQQTTTQKKRETLSYKF